MSIRSLVQTPAPWWKGAVIYQIYPRSFQDSNGDGVGDLIGIRNRLEYIADLGVDGIWISPFFTSPMKDFGYDVSDYIGVDPVFGDLKDFDSLLERAHALNLKVIIDQVYSHTSDQHEWFRDSRRARNSDRSDWYVWADAKPDGSPPNNWLSVFGGPAWSWDTSRRQYYLHNFLSEQPDLNFHNPDVQDAILDVAKFWLDQGVDGFRLDVANYYFHDRELRDNPNSGLVDNTRPYQFQIHRYNRSRPETLNFLSRLRNVIDQYDDRMTVAEIASGSNIERSIEYTQGKNRLHTAYNFHFLEQTEVTSNFVESAFKAWQDIDAWPSWSFSNHDVKRVLSRWYADKENPEQAKLLLALLFSLRGTAFLYQGEELGLPQAEVPFEALRDPEAIRFWPDNLGRDGVRTPMPWAANSVNAGFSSETPWLPIDDRHLPLALDQQLTDTNSTFEYTRKFLAARRQLQAMKTGTMSFLPTNGTLLAFERVSEGSRVLCIFNLTATVETFTGIAADLTLSPINDICLNAFKTENQITLEPYGCFFATIESS